MGYKNIIESAFNSLRQSKTISDLKRNGLYPLAVYETVYDMLVEMIDNNCLSSETISPDVRDWFASHGFAISKRGIGWEVRA